MTGIKSGILILLMALYSITNYAQSQSDITGEWDVGKQNTLVKIQQQNGVYYGKIKTSDNPKVKIGKLMVKDIVEKNGVFEGKLYVIKYRKWIDVLLNRKETELIISISSGRKHKTIRWELTQ